MGIFGAICAALSLAMIVTGIVGLISPAKLAKKGAPPPSRRKIFWSYSLSAIVLGPLGVAFLSLDSPTPTPSNAVVKANVAPQTTSAQPADAASQFEAAAQENPGCQAVGLFARQLANDRTNGVPYSDEVKAIKANVPDRQARSNMIDLTDQIYHKPWAMHLTPDGAYTAYYADCLARQ